MTREQVLEELCYYDIRNPDCTMTEEELKERLKKLNSAVKKSTSGFSYYICSCDNCLYGKNKLAIELLKYIDEKI